VRAGLASEDERREALRDAHKRAPGLEEEPGRASGFQAWRENLQADNFCLAELCDVANEERARRQIDGFEVIESELAAALEEERRRPEDRRRSVALLVVDMAEAKDPPLRLGKP
jgi:hypothetical protein